MVVRHGYSGVDDEQTVVAPDGAGGLERDTQGGADVVFLDQGDGVGGLLEQQALGHGGGELGVGPGGARGQVAGFLRGQYVGVAGVVAGVLVGERQPGVNRLVLGGFLQVVGRNLGAGVKGLRGNFGAAGGVAEVRVVACGAAHFPVVFVLLVFTDGHCVELDLQCSRVGCWIRRAQGHLVPGAQQLVIGALVAHGGVVAVVE